MKSILSIWRAGLLLAVFVSTGLGCARSTTPTTNPAVHGLVFSPDGKTLAAGVGAEVKLWDVASDQEKASLKGHTKEVLSVAFSGDGQTLASGGADETVRLWDVATGKESTTLRGHPSPICSVAFSDDGKTLASGSGRHDIMLTLWDLATGQQKTTLTKPVGEVTPVAFCPNRPWLAASGGTADGTVKIWNLETKAADLSVRLWSLKTKAANRGCFWLTSVAFSPDGKSLAAGGGYCEDPGRDPTENRPFSDSGLIKVWGVDSGKVIQSLICNSGAINVLVFSPDGKTLASVDWDIRGSDVRLWDLANGKEKGTFKGPSRHIDSIAFSPDGKILVCTDNAALHFWDVLTMKEIK